MTYLLRWPAALAPRSVALNPRNQSRLGPPTLTDRVQSWANDAGHWELTLRGIPVGGAANVNAFRAFLTACEGGAQQALVPVWDHPQAPWPAAGGREANENADEDFTGGYYFTGGYGWYDPAAQVYLDAAGSLRDTTVTISTTAAGTVTAGMRFSLLNERVHEIKEVVSATSWKIWPPLRRDYVSGVRCEFDRPRLRCKLAERNEGLNLERGIYDYVDLQMREAFA